MFEKLKESKRLAEQQQKQYESAEIIPLSKANYLRILRIIYIKIMIKPPLLLFFLISVILIFTGQVFLSEADFQTAILMSLSSMLSFFLLLPIGGVLLTYIRAMINPKYGFRKTGALHNF